MVKRRIIEEEERLLALQLSTRRLAGGSGRYLLNATAAVQRCC